MRLETHLKDINEQTGEMKEIVDNFVRFLIGDRDVALRRLQALKRTKATAKAIHEMEPEEYNKMYGNVYKGFMQVMKKYL